MPVLTKVWGWFVNNPIAQIITAFVLALIGWEIVKKNIQETGRIQERERIAAAQAKVREAVLGRKDEIISGERDNADSALEARNSEYPPTTFDQLPEPEKRVLDRRLRSGETS